MTTPAIHHVRNSRPIRTAAHPTRARGRTRLRALVFRFDQLPEVRRMVKTWDEVKALLGGKGANLAEMTRLGLPVPPGLHRHHRGLPRVPRTGNWPTGLWEAGGRRAAGAREADRQALRRPHRPAAGLLPLGRQVLDARDDGHRPEHRPERRDGAGPGRAHRRPALRLRRLPPADPDVRHRGAGRAATSRSRHVLAEWRGPAAAWRTTPTCPPRTCARIAERFQAIVREQSGRRFPHDPMEQLRLATEAVFRSWNGKRAQDYRNAAGIPDDLGHRGEHRGHGVRQPGRGAPAPAWPPPATSPPARTQLEGDFLINAQGEDVVGGHPCHPAHRRAGGGRCRRSSPQLQRIARLLEQHYRDVQDIEFTIERGKLWMLQTRDAKRTAHAAVRIAVDLAEGEADHPRGGGAAGHPRARGLLPPPAVRPRVDAQPRAASGAAGQRPQRLARAPPSGSWPSTPTPPSAGRSRRSRTVIMVRAETKPDDVHGMLAARGILTSRGGRTSHAALVARQFGKPAVVGAHGPGGRR